MSPPEILRLDGVDLHGLDGPLAAADGDDRVRVWEVEVWQVDLCHGVCPDGAFLAPEGHGEGAGAEVEKVFGDGAVGGYWAGPEVGLRGTIADLVWGGLRHLRCDGWRSQRAFQIVRPDVLVAQAVATLGVGRGVPVGLGLRLGIQGEQLPAGELEVVQRVDGQILAVPVVAPFVIVLHG